MGKIIRPFVAINWLFFRSANLDPFSLSLTSEELDRKVYALVPFRYELIFYGLKNTPCYSVYNDIVLVFARIVYQCIVDILYGYLDHGILPAWVKVIIIHESFCDIIVFIDIVT